MYCRLRGSLDWGRDVVRGDVQIRLLGGAEGCFVRLVRFSTDAAIAGTKTGCGRKRWRKEAIDMCYTGAVLPPACVGCGQRGIHVVL